MRSILAHWFRQIFLYPKDSISTKDESYEEYWKERGREEQSLSPWQKQRTDIICRYIKEENANNFTITDIGCGDGGVLSYLKRQYPNMNGIGVDFSQNVLAHVADAGFKTIEFDFSDPKNISIPDTDYIILFETIEHIVNSELLVEKACRASNKYVFISIPNSGFFTYRLRLLFGKFPMQWIQKPNEHVRFWTLSDVKWWLKALGLEKRAQIKTYEGLPLLNKVLPGIFSAGIVIAIKTDTYV